MIGEILFDKYTVVQKIGQGGMSEVFLVKNIKLGNFWAVKIINKYKGEKYGLLAEPHLLKELDHPAIPKIIDIEEDEEKFYIIEEYIQGESLALHKRKANQLEEKLILDFALQLCDVLHYLHSIQPKPIIYKDLKPENILLTTTNKLKVIDFGISQKAESNQKKLALGTKGYAPPEQYLLENVDERVDIYSLGMTLYYLMTGIEPKHIEGDIPFIEGYSKGFTKIVYKAIKNIPQERYQNIAHMKKELLNLYQKTKVQNLDFVKPIMITVSSSEKRMGSTHYGISVASYLKDKGYKVLIKEHHKSEDFLHLQSIYNLILENEVFKIKNIDFMPYDEEIYLIDLYKRNYNYIILDIGEMTHQSKKEFERGDIKLLVSGGKEWEIHSLERALSLLNDIEDIHYIFNFVDHKMYKELIKNMGKLCCYKGAYVPNPFDVTDLSKEIFNSIFRDYVKCNKKATFKNLWKRNG